MARLRRAHTQTKRYVDSCRQESGGKEASRGVVCGSKQISLHEMRKTLRKHEDDRQMLGSKVARM